MVVTIIMPVSRLDYLKRIFAQLEMLSCDAQFTNLLVYVDGDMELFDKTRNYVVQSKFAQKLCVYRRKGLADPSSVRRRRKRIAEIHNELKTMIGECDYIFSVEDDTLFPPNALQKLMQAYVYNPHAGFITGVQIGRWGYTTPGIWRVDNPYDVKWVQSLLPPIPQKPIDPRIDTIQEIDASGLYCLLTKREHYMSCTFEPFEDQLGPDFSFGIHLRKEGYKNYVDWSVNTAHLTKRGEIKVYNITLQQLTMTKTNDTWRVEAA